MDYQVRVEIQNAVECPQCFASIGYSCWTKGLTDLPHAERQEMFYRKHLKSLCAKFLSQSVGRQLLNQRIAASESITATFSLGNVKCVARGIFRKSTHPESMALFIEQESVSINEAKYRKMFDEETANRLIEDAEAVKFPDRYIAKYPERAQAIFDIQNELKYNGTSRTKCQIERIADAADALKLDAAYEHCAKMVWRAKKDNPNYQMGEYA